MVFVEQPLVSPAVLDINTDLIGIYFQIWSQELSLLPNVPLARFFSGGCTDDSLSPEREKSNSLVIQMYISLFVHTIQVVVKTLSAKKFATSYINEMRENMIDNFMNFFSSKVAIIAFSLGVAVANFHVLIFGDSENKYVLSLSYHTVVFIIVSFPYRGHPLR